MEIYIIGFLCAGVGFFAGWALYPKASNHSPAHLSQLFPPSQDWVRLAALDMRGIVDNACVRFDVDAADPESGRGHLHDMIDTILSCEVTGLKAHRWLGYIQGVTVCAGQCDLATVEWLNKKASEALQSAPL